MIIPEVILYKFVKSCLQLIRLDFEANTLDETKTILYSLFKTDDNGDQLIFESYDYFAQAKSLFTRKVEHSRQLDVYIGYNLQRAAEPTIHIILPNENKGRYDSIGDQSNTDNVYSEVNQTVTVTKETTHTPVYNLLLTSDNSSEVLLIYYWLRAMITIYKEHLELKGIQNLKFSGADIILQQEFAPPNIFHRSLSVDFDYPTQYKVTIPMDISSNIGLTICSDIGDEFNKYINP